MEDQQTKKARRGKADGEVDRLSDLPDCVLLHILSFVNTLDAVKTCVLSKRWRHLWRLIPTLTLLSSNFCRLRCFRKFVSRVLFGCDDTITLHNLYFECRRGFGRAQTQFLDRVINHAISHNVQQLTLSVTGYTDCPPCLFSSSSLISLKIESYGPDIILPKSLDLPALTSLHLGNCVKLSTDDNGRAQPFGNCSKLNTLVIEGYLITETPGIPGILCIANNSLTNLMIGKSFRHLAPKIELFTPNLRSFTVKGDHWNQMIQFSGHNLDFLEEAYIDVKAMASGDIRSNALILMDMWRLLSNVKCMTITSSTIQVLSDVCDSLETQSPCLGKLKSLKVVAHWDIPDGILVYLLQNSPMAKITFIDRLRNWFMKHCYQNFDMPGKGKF